MVFVRCLQKRVCGGKNSGATGGLDETEGKLPGLSRLVGRSYHHSAFSLESQSNQASKAFPSVQKPAHVLEASKYSFSTNPLCFFTLRLRPIVPSNPFQDLRHDPEDLRRTPSTAHHGNARVCPPLDACTASSSFNFPRCFLVPTPSATRLVPSCGLCGVLRACLNVLFLAFCLQFAT